MHDPVVVEFFEDAHGQLAETSRPDHERVANEIDAWFADASLEVSVSAPDGRPESSPALVGAAGLLPQTSVVQPCRPSRPVVSRGRAKQGLHRTRRSERAHRLRLPARVLVLLAVGTVLLAVLVMLAPRSSSPDEAASRSTVSTRTVIATGVLAEQHRRERARARRAERALTRRRAAARGRGAASRRADHRRAKQRDQPVPVRTPQRVPASQVAEPPAARPQLQRPTPSVPTRDPPAATAEFEP